VAGSGHRTRLEFNPRSQLPLSGLDRTMNNQSTSEHELDLVVIGLGYVGLPLVVAACGAGLRVVGIDASQRVVSRLNKGSSHILDVADDEIKECVSRGFIATNDFSPVATAQATVICVPTPLDESGGPDLSAVTACAGAIARELQQGSLVVLESTTYPGTTDEVLRPVLEESGLMAGEDFHLAFSPERVDPGNETFGIRNTPKLVGGYTAGCAALARDLYAQFVDEIVVTKSTREAEMAKLLENTYRHVNIALVNEMAVFCHDLGIDLWDSIRAAATKPFGFQAFWPGPGVGGHCIPIDPNYLSYKVRSLGYPFRFVELAQEISDRMPAYVVSRAQGMLNDVGLAVKGADVLLLGVTYKANVADERESPSIPVAERFLELGASLSYADPYVPRWEVDASEVPRVDLASGLSRFDLIVLLQSHTEFLEVGFESVKAPILDCRDVIAGDNVTAL